MPLMMCLLLVLYVGGHLCLYVTGDVTCSCLSLVVFSLFRLSFPSFFPFFLSLDPSLAYSRFERGTRDTNANANAGAEIEAWIHRIRWTAERDSDLRLRKTNKRRDRRTDCLYRCPLVERFWPSCSCLISRLLPSYYFHFLFVSSPPLNAHQHKYLATDSCETCISLQFSEPLLVACFTYSVPFDSSFSPLFCLSCFILTLSVSLNLKLFSPRCPSSTPLRTFRQ